jgi:hypothetical protein
MELLTNEEEMLAIIRAHWAKLIAQAPTAEDHAKRKAAFIGTMSDDERAERNAHAGRLKGYSGPPVPEYIGDLHTFMSQGGMYRIEQRAAIEAAKDARRAEQEYWLETLETMIAEDRVLPEGAEVQWGDFFRGKNEDPTELTRSLVIDYAGREIKRLRRILGKRQTPEEKRAATRERVRRHRAKRCIT